MASLRGLIFDVDGTLAETEELHRAAFNQAFEEAGLGWTWRRDDYRRLLRTTGGKERIAQYAGEVGKPGLDIAALHRRKTAIYGERMASGRIALRPGVENLIRTAREREIALAIATTTTRANVEALFAATLGTEALDWFAAVCTANEAPVKKPDPQVYLLALQILGLGPDECLAFEDSANGLKAALAAGITTVVTPSTYTADDDFSGAALVIRDLEGLAEAQDRWTGSNPAGGVTALLRSIAA
ncbi:MAG: HAD-IA family hydrolase [Notoacmeibacter sp.]|nr:HAD-IA family hydrolase [Notoacmeibacter sp.]